MEARGYAVQLDGAGVNRFKAIIQGEPVTVNLSASSCSLPEFKRSGSIKLTLGIAEYVGEGYHQKWSDGKAVPLEEKIGYFIDGLERLCPLVRERRMEREQEEALAKAKEIRKATEAHKWKQLQTDVEGWETSNLLLRFIVTAQAQATASTEEQECLAEWVNWATQRAIEVDPLSDGVGTFLERYKLPSGTLRPFSWFASAFPPKT